MVIRRSRIVTIALLAAAALGSPLPAAQTVESAGIPGLTAQSRTPLVIIRFSQRNVYFERALSTAVGKAIETKPNVAFDVVLHPGFRSTGGQASLEKVVQAVGGMGISPAQITAATGTSSNSAFDEVYVYVR